MSVERAGERQLVERTLSSREIFGLTTDWNSTVRGAFDLDEQPDAPQLKVIKEGCDVRWAIGVSDKRISIMKSGLGIVSAAHISLPVDGNEGPGFSYTEYQPGQEPAVSENTQSASVRVASMVRAVPRLIEKRKNML